MALIYGIGAVRVTVKDSAGANLARYTFQTVNREGLKLVFTPEGKDHQLGSGATYRKGWTSRKHRPSLECAWSAGLSSWKESWVSGSWAAATEIKTVEAIPRVLQGAVIYPALVESHTDHAFTFEAQPDLKAFEFTDIKGRLHSALSMVLIGKARVTEPTWVSSPSPYRYPLETLGAGAPLMLHANAPTRVALYDAGGTPVRRWTLQMHDRAGRTASWKPEGVAVIGALPDGIRTLQLTGWRPSVKAKWAYDTGESLVETWSGSAWGTAAAGRTAEALADIAFYGDVHDLLVDPFGTADTWASFQARPFAQKLNLQDTKGIFHKGLELVLEGVTSQSQILA